MVGIGRQHVALSVIFCSLNVPSMLAFNINPVHKHIPKQEAVNVTCSLSIPLTRCQFKLGAADYVEVPPTNNSGGSESYVFHGNQSATGEKYMYYGGGLQAGDCGVQLHGSLFPDNRVTLVTCRVHSAQHGWAYSSMAVFNDAMANMTLNVDSREVVSVPGTDITFEVRTLESWSACKVKLSKWKKFKIINKNEQNCKTRQKCRCWYTFTKISVNNSGNVFFEVKSTSNGREMDFIRHIVSQKPEVPVLILTNETPDYDGSVSLTVWCNVTGSRPAANITWLLDDSPIIGGEVEFIPGDDDWVDPFDDQTVIQQLTLTLDGSAHGKKLQCRAEHSMLNISLVSNEIQIVEKAVPQTVLYIIIGVLASLLIAILVGVLCYACCHSTCGSSRSGPAQVPTAAESDFATEPVYAQVTDSKAERKLKNVAEKSMELDKQDEFSNKLHRNSLYVSQE